jgi:hypothetical protein
MLFRHTPGFPVVPSFAEHWLSAVQAPHVFDVQIGAVVTLQSLLATHTTHCPATVPVVAQTVLPSVRPAHPVAPVVLQPVQAFATQKPFDEFAVHWESPVHCTHCPAAVPVVAQVVLPSVCPVQPVAPAELQPVHAFATQKPLAGSAVHWLSPVHCTHCPAAVPVAAQVVLPSVRPAQPVAPEALQPVHSLATQKPLARSAVHWLSPVHCTH